MLPRRMGEVTVFMPLLVTTILTPISPARNRADHCLLTGELHSASRQICPFGALSAVHFTVIFLVYVLG